ncbi:alpha-ketoglutarate-dependent dioxygenase AlkB [Parvibaculum sp.]|uniref:alpha-ketoglutarate-dependent dioxygenase AlkB n=1 Tax=Parvibaculum sp. TaxID=2024848 RepID=UPI001AFE0F48|nr:alpha-ketoglutarate-dependent dioxygenase AlkB [Parvibaculum sp.]MBO6634821.1 alpha-ketoglutarate-dependent dioxygenase AlkB [Parvibaculum sp.]MBO6677198.1 alpha-ketoglutarate-dependent dioxygenase AlkB [Parvibaculum sp.]MBO6685041.1 alpha-ketoglutarate-dependent dioxygenase AlkB [Parvibaculum sp.]MBO6906177.1 alpha-ketoglutarate-dependent dioxygenase AlkB [Parvibaculum sp.]
MTGRMNFLPAGATYLSDFIGADEEAALVRALDDGVWSAELRRRVQHFGYRYDYTARTVTADAYIGELPDWATPVCRKLRAEADFGSGPDQAIANEYLPGQGISAHVDCVPCFSERIASLSLLSSCEMIFRNKKKGERLSAILEPRSLLILSGEARYEWTHEIPARKSDEVNGVKQARGRRISLTFRTVTPA